MSVVRIDYETASDLDVTKVGPVRYGQDPSTEILCVSWRVDDGPVQTWTPEDIDPPRFPDDAIFEAHNAGFEVAIWTYVGPRYDWPPCPKPGRWRCTAARAAFAALPRALEDVAIVLNVPVKKDVEGNKAMKMISNKRRARKLTPEKYGELYKRTLSYNRDDVRAEHGVSLHADLPNLPPDEYVYWQHDQLVNRRGIHVDTAACRAAILKVKEALVRADAECKELTGGIGPRQSVTLAGWLGLDNVTKRTVEEAIERLDEDGLDPKARRVLAIRQQASLSSTSKFQALLNRCGPDSRARDMLMYHGAHTGRVTGKGFQPQNLTRTQISDDQVLVEAAVQDVIDLDYDDFELVWGDVMENLSGMVRPMLSAAPGKELIAGDFNLVEVCVNFWMAYEEAGLQQIRDGRDLYKELASTIYNKAVEDIVGGERQFGKTGILGLGFQMGKDTFEKQCDAMRLNVERDMTDRAVDVYRSKYPRVKGHWYELDDVAKMAIDNPGQAFDCRRCQLKVVDPYLMIRLPSGRVLRYYQPEIVQAPAPWDPEQLTDQIRYWGVNSYTRKWSRLGTYGGKLVENVVQATARDLLVRAQVKLERAGYPVVLSVHDETVSEIPKGFGSQAEFDQIMADPPDWAAGLPIAVEGWRGHRYRKD